MMTRAYSELYLDNAMECLGEMFSFAIDACGYDPDEFYRWFIQSGLADEFGSGNPRCVAGLSGIELADEVVYRTRGRRLSELSAHVSVREDKSPAYWAGWILAYYQWHSGYTFKKIYYAGLTMEKIMSMYLLHEADVSRFVEEADDILDKKDQKKSNLQLIRKARGLTQQQLSEGSGVTLRMIQLYEQKKNDINNAAVATVRNLAQVLGCQITDLME